MAICPSKKCKIVDTKSTHDGFLPQISQHTSKIVECKIVGTKSTHDGFLPQISQHTSKIVDIRSIGDKFLAHF